MCKKCICLCRVSTLHQDLEAQREKVVNAAIADGYTMDEIAVIEKKESAIKLSEEERESLNEMKEIINDNPSIESVYVFAIDRLARKVSIVLSVKDYLTEHGINLVFLNPHKMGTLRKDEKTGKLIEDELTSMLLMFLSYGAEMEMKIKKERFQAAKDMMAKQGKAVTGLVKFGYKLDENKKAVIDENTANIVRRIFTEYTFTDISLLALERELVNEGLIAPMLDSMDNVKRNRIRQILIHPAYSGNNFRATKYPAIVSEKLQQEAIKRMSEKKTGKKYEHKNIYYAKGLLFTNDGRALFPLTHVVTYRTRQDSKLSMVSVNINVIDSILWNEATTLKQVDNYENLNNATINYQARIKQLNTIIENIDSQIQQMESKKVRAYKQYVNGKVDDNVFNEITSDIDKTIKDLNKQIVTAENEISYINMQLESLESEKVLSEDEVNTTDDNVRKEIIRSVIEKITVEKIDEYKTKIVVYPDKRFSPTDKYYIYEHRGNKMNLTKTIGFPFNKTIDVTNIIEKRYKAVQKQKGSQI